MSRRLGRPAKALVVAVFALALAACGPRASATPDIASPVDGIVIAVDAGSLTEVRDFTLRISGGAAILFKLGALENATQFSPSHLSEHLATSVPVRVWFQVVNGDRVVYRLEDAPGAAPAT